MFFLPNGKLHLFTGPELLKQLRMATAAIGPDILGFTAKQIGLHSARSGTAMTMFLAGIPVFTIMLLGHWSSDAFLRYIRKQVKESSAGVSQKMILYEDFFTIPTQNNNEPGSSNHSSNLVSRNKPGVCLKEVI
jgi:hypothetical protein